MKRFKCALLCLFAAVASAAAKDGGGPVPKNSDGKKFVHPANANRSHHKRTNFQGRRQPDFGQK